MELVETKTESAVLWMKMVSADESELKDTRSTVQADFYNNIYAEGMLISQITFDKFIEIHGINTAQYSLSIGFKCHKDAMMFRLKTQWQN